MTLETVKLHRCFDGTQGIYRHQATTTHCAMRFAVFVPPQARQEKVPVLTYLSGLTCTEENFITKAGAQRMAAKLGVILVAPDTSPRGPDVPGDPEGAWDFGHGAGYYLDATQAPYSTHYHMYSYIVRELPDVIAANFPADMTRQGIFGHSMGGHGALTIAMKNPETYRSVSAFAPISAPMQAPGGKKCFKGYLGPDRETWRQYDATDLVTRTPVFKGREILIDQGLADEFLGTQLKPELFETACAQAGVRLIYRAHKGYDHGYYFISSFIDDHLRWHGERLGIAVTA